MINIVLFDSESVGRIIQRAKKFFRKDEILGISESTLWLKGCYLEFNAKSIILNPYNLHLFSKNDVFACMSYLLGGEEVYILDSNYQSKYFTKVKPTDTFDIFLQN